MRRSLALSLALSLCAFAAGSAAAQTVPAAPAPLPPEPALDFELDLPALKQENPVDPELERKIALRRKMLEVHPVLGLATLAGLGATAVLGQLNLNDKYGGGGDTGRYRNWHRGFAYGSAVLFATTGLLGVLAPEPFEKHARFDRLDTATLHKLLMALASLGMVAQIGLGVTASLREGHLDQRSFAQVHQAVGYATFGAMSAGFAVLLF